ncbi:MAG: hypothetical protein A3H31_01645 [Gallionellales bacterium RIFCSPLOWO2_02_FULL_57_47]|nr:MAG: hypothetical protein A3H31_01645 [Gallionellales bacterium RIFCSPLOWO2_02_FULL_57_47]
MPSGCFKTLPITTKDVLLLGVKNGRKAAVWDVKTWLAGFGIYPDANGNRYQFANYFFISVTVQANVHVLENDFFTATLYRLVVLHLHFMTSWSYITGFFIDEFGGWENVNNSCCQTKHGFDPFVVKLNVTN